MEIMCNIFNYVNYTMSKLSNILFLEHTENITRIITTEANDEGHNAQVDH